MSKNQNPLKQFYRVEKTTVKLPSRGLYYDDSVVTLSPDNDLGIMPMTAADELLLKNPDALLSGQAILGVIKSCVPAVKQPQKLLSCDIDTIMIGIRDASYGEDSTVTIKCPKCDHENTYSLNLDILLNQTEALQDSYIAEISNQVQVFVKPGTFEAIIKKQKSMLENRKVERLLTQESVGEEERMHLIAGVFLRLSKLNYELIVDGVQKICFPNQETGELTTVIDKTHIDEFIRNIDKKQVEIIEEKLREVNKVGIATTMPAVCTNCSHEWDAPIDFNPANFS
jgi:hypothetical protein